MFYWRSFCTLFVCVCVCVFVRERRRQGLLVAAAAETARTPQVAAGPIDNRFVDGRVAFSFY